MDPRFKLKMDNDAIWDRLKTTDVVEKHTGAEEVF